jgi:PIN domain nuclease of toxin-antitoxin system
LHGRRGGGTVFISAVTAWEIALMVDTGRIELDSSVETWIDRFLDRPGVEVMQSSHRAACRSYRLHHLPHRDPADRLLIARAIELGCPLLTYDQRIVGFAEVHGHQIKNPRSKLRGIGGRKEADQKNAASCGEYVPKEIQLHDRRIAVTRPGVATGTAARSE